MKIVEVFYSIQGEGIHTGHSAVFIRLSGCNLKCPFCDTDYSRYTEMGTGTIVDKVHEVAHGRPMIVVITGGEPFLQIDNGLQDLCYVLSNAGYKIEVETNGTIAIPDNLKKYLSWTSFSPKTPRHKIQIKGCTSLKLLYPYLSGCDVSDYDNFPAVERFIQPISPPGEHNESYIFAAVAEVKKLGWPWRLGVQLHKIVGIR